MVLFTTAVGLAVALGILRAIRTEDAFRPLWKFMVAVAGGFVAALMIDSLVSGFDSRQLLASLEMSPVYLPLTVGVWALGRSRARRRNG